MTDDREPDEVVELEITDRVKKQQPEFVINVGDIIEGYSDEKAELKLLAGEQGPGFLMLRNFFVLKRYNNADAYALGVGLLADRLAGYPGMVQSWPRPPESLNGDEKIELQQLLKKKGYYDGQIDGNLGKGSRAAIAEFQRKAGVTPDGAPSKSILLLLRK